MEVSHFSCVNCTAKDKELQIHHKFYEFGRKPWEYGVDELECLCCDCHKKVGEYAKGIKELMTIQDSSKLRDIYLSILAETNDATIGYWLKSGSDAFEFMYYLVPAYARQCPEFQSYSEMFAGNYTFFSDLAVRDLRPIADAILRDKPVPEIGRMNPEEYMEELRK